jgi:CRISPR/Cas system-associated exonuclease Cas4 (RecB family)
LYHEQKNMRTTIERSIEKLTSDRTRLERLLALEKRRRGFPNDRLTFVGMHNVAQHWWCTQQALLESQAGELGFFDAYLKDRLSYAHRLGLIEKLPRRDEEVLDVGKQITLLDIEKLVASEPKRSPRCDKASDSGFAFSESEDANGKPTLFINPNLPEIEKRSLEDYAKAKGASILAIGEIPPLQRGEILEQTEAESYTKLRWNFAWRKYTVVGVPDGITNEFVYEYKTTGSRYLLNFAKPVGLAQADLYGYFFQRPRKRVQIKIVEEGKTETYDEPVDVARAEQTLAAFARVDEGEPARPPQPAWKCRNCVFNNVCRISHNLLISRGLHAVPED